MVSGPTLLCSGRRWRGLYAGRDLGAWWHTSARAGLSRSPAAPLKAGVGRRIKRWHYCQREYHDQALPRQFKAVRPRDLADVPFVFTRRIDDSSEFLTRTNA